MSPFNIALYAGAPMGPTAINQNLSDFANSGFNTLILGLAHIGRANANGPENVGDIIFNDKTSTFVHDGVYLIDSSYNDTLLQLKSSGKVNNIYLSIGGASNVIFDFRTIQYLIDGPGDQKPNPYVTYGTGPNSTLYKNFTALRQGMTALDGIDMDNEELFAVKPATMTAFTTMLIKIGFKITYCPFNDQSYWNDCFYAIYKNDPTAITWWNLQCYAGGGSNDPNEWIQNLNSFMHSKGVSNFNAQHYILPGLFARHNAAKKGMPPFFAGDCPSTMESKFGRWVKAQGGTGLIGGFVWQYDDILNTLKYTGTGCDGQNTTADYASNIARGLMLPAAEDQQLTNLHSVNSDDC